MKYVTGRNAFLKHTIEDYRNNGYIQQDGTWIPVDKKSMNNHF
jgi:hypothetical protein